MCYSTKIQTFRKLNTALFYVHFSLIICFVVTFCFRKSNLPATHAALALQFLGIWSSNMKMFACNEIEPGLLYQQTLETIWSFIFILWIHTGSMVHACPKSLLAPFFFLEPILNWHSIAFFLSPDPTSAHLPIFRGMRCRLLAKMMSSFNFLDCSWPQRQHPHLWKFDDCWRDGRWPVAEGFGIKLQEVNSVTIFYFP